MPPADVRGDVARAILYMDLRYEGDEGSTTLDLVVSDCPETVPDGAGMGYLSQLLQWHIDDPVDDDERERNEKVCANWQGNRNPFIDFPELATIYHGGPRTLLGDGLGYDCSTPAPSGGVCSDGSGPCINLDHCFCSSSSTSRNLQSTQRNNDIDISAGENQTVERELEVSTKLMISGVLDGPLSGGLPKMIELYALDDIDDLCLYGIGTANNGGGTDGVEYTLPCDSIAAGTYITIGYESTKFLEYFGEEPDYTASALYVNGDDAIELFYNYMAVDAFGDTMVDGTGQAWEYMDGWAYRIVGTSPSTNFVEGDWILTGKDAVDGCSDNDSCGSSFPFKSFSSGNTQPPPPSSTTGSPTHEPKKSPVECECTMV